MKFPEETLINVLLTQKRSSNVSNEVPVFKVINVSSSPFMDPWRACCSELELGRFLLRLSPHQIFFGEIENCFSIQKYSIIFSFQRRNKVFKSNYFILIYESSSQMKPISLKSSVSNFGKNYSFLGWLPTEQGSSCEPGYCQYLMSTPTRLPSSLQLKIASADFSFFSSGKHQKSWLPPLKVLYQSPNCKLIDLTHFYIVCTNKF